MSTIEQNPDTIASTVVRFLRRIKSGAGEIGLETPFFDDGLGLDSLETAELSALLEDEFGSDPYSQGELPDRVSQIVDFYTST